jgi:hypothetical protein
MYCIVYVYTCCRDPYNGSGWFGVVIIIIENEDTHKRASER